MKVIMGEDTQPYGRFSLMINAFLVHYPQRK